MSSDVQAKCTNSSSAAVAPAARELLAHEVLDRLDVVVRLTLDRLDAGDAGLVHAPGERLEARRRRRRTGGRAPAKRPDSASCRNHAASTRTRRAIRAASLKSAARSAHLSA